MPPGLFMSCLTCAEIGFEEITAIGNVLGSYHTSLPTGLPQSCSE